MPGSNDFFSKMNDCIIKARSGYVLRKVVDEYMLIPVALGEHDSSKVSILNETGAFLWEHIQNDVTGSELLGAMLDEFDVSADVAENDIREFINILINKDLVDMKEA